MHSTAHSCGHMHAQVSFRFQPTHASCGSSIFPRRTDKECLRSLALATHKLGRCAFGMWSGPRHLVFAFIEHIGEKNSEASKPQQKSERNYLGPPQVGKPVAQNLNQRLNPKPKIYILAEVSGRSTRGLQPEKP